MLLNIVAVSCATPAVGDCIAQSPEARKPQNSSLSRQLVEPNATTLVVRLKSLASDPHLTIHSVGQWAHLGATLSLHPRQLVQREVTWVSWVCRQRAHVGADSLRRFSLVPQGLAPMARRQVPMSLLRSMSSLSLSSLPILMVWLGS